MLLAARILQEKRAPGSTLAWLMAIVLAPYVGVPLYLLIGGRKFSRNIHLIERLYTPGAEKKDDPLVPAAGRIVSLAGFPAPRVNNHIVFHSSGETAFAALLSLFEEARVSIHVSTFILGKDDTGRAIVEALAKKAEEGVEVRLLLDSLGCLTTSRGFVQPIRDAGGEARRFLPVLPMQRKWSANLRNHRKIVVVDHVAAMVGGMNLATQFMGAEADPHRYVDDCVFLYGPAVYDIEEVFRHDWEFASGKHLPLPEGCLFPQTPQPLLNAMTEGLSAFHAVDQCMIQVVPSGPDVSEDTFHDALLTAIMEAEKRIWLMTPYFVPDASLLKPLALKARGGCDVRIIVPLRSNHGIADLARGPALRELSAAGGAIYVCPAPMIHAKVMLFDHNLAITGSPNLDMRSIYLNFEIALFHYTPGDLDVLEAWMRQIQLTCHMIRPQQVSRRRAWAENLSHLISPLL
ncbi:MAG: cardiolipin synthase [Candidatus Hydrogenedens sp.]|nr:cardiolipin synthase [Candidatus Hydrogenedens sp.]